MSQLPDEGSDSGSFNRQEDDFRGSILEAESGRYHLYVCKACPWAHRASITLRLNGLERAIGVSFADPIRDQRRGWAFREGDGHGNDTAEGFNFLSEAYQATDSSFKGRVTVPVLWDKTEKRIVNNSEDDICQMWATSFLPLARNPVDLFPENIREEQKALSEKIYLTVNNGVYRAGFATTQSAYRKAFEKLFATLDQLEARLAKRGPYLLGAAPVETDWRLFCTLVRFDAVYHGHFKCNLRKIAEYPSLQSYLERLYRLPGIKETVNFDHIKRHYYLTHDEINPTQIVPLGPTLDWA